MEKSVEEISRILDAKLEGDPNIKIKGIRSLSQAGAGDLSFMASTKYLEAAKTSKASALIVPQDTAVSGKTLLMVDNPLLALAQVIESFNLHQIPHPQGIHPTALIGAGAEIEPGVAMGPYTVIGDYCWIGAGTILHAGVQMGSHTRVGKNCIFYSNVVLRERIRIGDRVIIHPGTVIGEDGFSYVSTEAGHRKIPQIGDVLIEDDVEIGANCCIDRGALDSTVIQRGTKIGNLTLVAHNDIIGENCLLAGHIALGGSVVIGKNSTLGGQVGVRDHVELAEGVRLAGKSGVTHDLIRTGDYAGIPAKEADTFFRIQDCLNRLPDLTAQWEKIQKGT